MASNLSSEVPRGGMFICRPQPIPFHNGTSFGLTLMSDLHIGARNVDYDLIAEELCTAKKHGDRILINGDVFDAILIQDRKRFRADVLHPKLVGKVDTINAAIEWAVKILSPYADAIDMIGIGNHECFDDQTEVLTTDGWIPFPSLTPGHKVASYREGAIEFVPPLRVHQYEYDGNMVAIQNNHVDLLVTPNHRILYKPANYVESDRRRIGQGGAARVQHKWRAYHRVNGKMIYGTVRDTREEALADADTTADKSKIHLSYGWRMQEAGTLPKIGMRMVCSGQHAGSGANVTDDELRAVAWLLTDGWLTRKGGVRICQRVSKCHMVRDVLNACGWEFREKVRKRTITAICGKTLKKEPEPSVELSVHNEGRKRLVELVPTKKRLPLWLWQCTKAQFDIFLQSYIDGDGSRHPSRPETSLMVYGRELILSDLQALCTINGYRSTLVEYRPGAWRLNVTPRQLTSFKTNTSELRPYRGMVYCVTTHNDTVVVRRNGKVCVTGNSAIEKYHSVDMVKFLTHELRKHRKNKHHVIHYGGYCGFVDYRFRYRLESNTECRGSGKRFVVFYHHGSGGAAPITKGMIDLSRKGWVDADLVWMGHRHVRVASAIQTISCPQSGYEPNVKDVRQVISGAYFETYQGQTQRSLDEHGRVASYAADMGCAPQGMGGARVILQFVAKNEPYQVKVIQ